MGLRIVADQQIALVEETFSSFGKVHLVDSQDITSAEIRDADVLLVRSVTQVNEKLLENSQVTFVGSATSGTDHIDKLWLQDQNIVFADAPGSNARAVAEYVLSCLCILEKVRLQPFNTLTVAIVGCGNVGTQLHAFLTALGIQCLINDPPLKDLTADPMYCKFSDIFEADVLTLHVPLVADGDYPTYHW